MSTIQVKPNPSVDPKAWPKLVHPASGSLLDANSKVPDDGRPWLYDGFTCRMLTDGAILRADDPVFAALAAQAKADAEAAAAKVAAETPTPAVETPAPAPEAAPAAQSEEPAPAGATTETAAAH